MCPLCGQNKHDKNSQKLTVKKTAKSVSQTMLEEVLEENGYYNRTVSRYSSHTSLLE